MKNTNTALLYLSLITILQSCSPNDDSSANNENENPTIIRKDIQSIFPAELNELYLLTENDLITKFYSNSTTTYNHCVFNSNSQIEGIYWTGTGSPSLPFQGFNYDYVTGATTPPGTQFFYTNDVLTNITSSLNSHRTFIYDSNGRIGTIIFGDITVTVTTSIRYIYGEGDNPIAYIQTSPSSQPQRWELTFDNRVNPFYKAWENNSFPYSLSLNSLSTESEGYFKNNLILRENLATNESLFIDYNYDNDDHPTFYRILRPNGTTRTGTINYN